MKRTKADKATVASSSGSSGVEVATSNTNSTKVQKESQDDNDLEGGALLEDKQWGTFDLRSKSETHRERLRNRKNAKITKETEIMSYTFIPQYPTKHNIDTRQDVAMNWRRGCLQMISSEMVIIHS